KKEKIDFLNAIKAGRSGFIAGNPAHALDDKTMNAIIHDYEATIAPGKAGKFEDYARAYFS
ncbi:hypothetical protein ACNDH0_004605, partial [Escherichia coli]